MLDVRFVDFSALEGRRKGTKILLKKIKELKGYFKDDIDGISMNFVMEQVNFLSDIFRSTVTDDTKPALNQYWKKASSRKKLLESLFKNERKRPAICTFH
ncbi:MAG: hypothetical protein V7733_02810 [Paraglaciecola polaris]|uniref:hypothetical protein n=1 Tax=Paraglaciecola polaris TaxID=222814 RepID=UPI003001137E